MRPHPLVVLAALSIGNAVAAQGSVEPHVIQLSPTTETRWEFFPSAGENHSALVRIPKFATQGGRLELLKVTLTLTSDCAMGGGWTSIGPTIGDNVWWEFRVADALGGGFQPPLFINEAWMSGAGVFPQIPGGELGAGGFIRTWTQSYHLSNPTAGLAGPTSFGSVPFDSFVGQGVLELPWQRHVWLDAASDYVWGGSPDPWFWAECRSELRVNYYYRYRTTMKDRSSRAFPVAPHTK